MHQWSDTQLGDTKIHYLCKENSLYSYPHLRKIYNIRVNKEDDFLTTTEFHPTLGSTIDNNFRPENLTLVKGRYEPEPQVPVDATQYPYSANGVVITEFDDAGKTSKIYCSGTLVGPYHILMDIHSLCNPSKRDCFHKTMNISDDCLPTKITFIPGLNQDDKPYGVACGLMIKFAYRKNIIEPVLHDTAMILLDRPIGEQTGWLGLYYNPAGAELKKTVHVTGYQSQIDNIQSTIMTTLSSKVTIGESDLNKIKHHLNATECQSGATLWIEHQQKYYAIGVNYYFSTTMERARSPDCDGFKWKNEGTHSTRITYESFSKLFQWMTTPYITAI